MPRGRRCCCCLDLYNFDRPDMIRVKGGSADYYIANATIGNNNARGVFDYFNKECYFPSNLTLPGSKIFKSDNHFTTVTTVATMTGNYKVRNVVGVYPWGNRIYYGARDDVAASSHVELRRMNYDGSGDVSLLNKSAGTGGAVITWISVSKEEEYVFYSEVWTGHCNVRRCNFDGSNDTLILDASGFANITRICLDNVNKYIYMVYSPTTSRTISRCDFNGGGLIPIVVGASNIPPFPSTDNTTGAGNYLVTLAGWSHLRERLFIVCSNAISGTVLDGLGLYSCKFDGSDMKREIAIPHIVDIVAKRSDTQFFTLNAQYVIGCGYEKTGGATKGVS